MKERIPYEFEIQVWYKTWLKIWPSQNQQRRAICATRGRKIYLSLKDLCQTNRPHTLNSLTNLPPIRKVWSFSKSIKLGCRSREPKNTFVITCIPFISVHEPGPIYIYNIKVKAKRWKIKFLKGIPTLHKKTSSKRIYSRISHILQPHPRGWWKISLIMIKTLHIWRFLWNFDRLLIITDTCNNQRYTE